MDQKAKKMIDSVEYVSFDIFDTLIVRNINRPIDVFDVVENEYNKKNKNKISDFRKKRVDIERKCRLKSKYEEVTIGEIYNQLEIAESGIDANLLMNIEQSVEVDLCQFNNNIKEIFEYCKNKKKKIIITSDMYLDEITIKKILSKNNIKYEKLFLSSVVRLTKETGNLFKYLLNDLGINPNNIIHIGDNENSDYRVPKKLKIKSIIIKNKKTDKEYYNINLNIIRSYLYNNQLKYTDVFSDFGYNLFGPLLLCFSKWLIGELENNNINKVFFFSRDGYIMKKAFDIINVNSGIRSYYFYASRRAIIVPSLFKCNSIEEILGRLSIGRKTNIETILKKMGLDDQLENIRIKYNINTKKEYFYKDLMKDEKITKLLNDIYPLVIENSKKEFNSFINYKNYMDFNDRVAIVDIGWFGNIQNALESLELNLDIYGYYMGLREDNKFQEKYKMKGFLFDKYHDTELDKKENEFNSIFELIFLAQHGSIKRYNNCRSEHVEFYKYEYNDLNAKQQIVNLQNKAIDFIKKFYKSGILKYLDGDMNYYFYYMCDKLLYPDNITADAFGNIPFLDNGIKYIAKPDKWYRYFNVIKFIRSYKNAQWKQGFLKRVFKVKLPYNAIINFSRKLKKIRR